MRRNYLLVIGSALLFLLSACATGQPESGDVTPVDSKPAVTEIQDNNQTGACLETTAASEQISANEGESGSDPAHSTSAVTELQDNSQPGSDDGNSTDSETMSDQDDNQSEAQIDVADQGDEINNGDGSSGGSGIERPAWQHLALTNARTGESFTLADFSGQTIFVETMATWCTRCRQQLDNVRDAHRQFADDEVVFVALSVETNIDDTTLASYADGSVYDWLFAVSTPELIEQLAEEFGRAIIVPPSTPHFIIRPDGTHTELTTGVDPATQIVSQINAARG